MDATYVQKQVSRYRQFSSQASKIDCLHRIASHADLFAPDQMDYDLTTEQQDTVKQWLNRNGFLA